MGLIVAVVNIDVPHKLLCDIVTTAVEGGIGYWSECEWYRWTDPTDESPNTTTVDARAKIRSIAGDVTVVKAGWPIPHGPGPWVVNWSTVENGLRRIVDRDSDFKHVSNAWRARVVSELFGGDPDFDASDADMIVQIGLFGDVVFA